MKNTIKLLFLGLFLFGITATRAQISSANGGSLSPNVPNTNTNVGIGTTNPVAKLDLGGTTNQEIGVKTALSNYAFYGAWQDEAIIAINIRPSDGTFTQTTKGTASINLNSNTSGSYIKFTTNNIANTLGVERMRINENGYVGIGTQNPIGKFDVRGNVFIGTTDLSIGSVGSFVQIDQGSSTGNSYSQIRAYSNGGNINNNLVLQSTVGNVGIGSTNPDQKLTVKGKIHAEEIIVDLAVPADYVFQKYYTGKSELKSDYFLPTLAEIESFTKENHHLPNVPSAQEIKQNGLPLGEMSNVLLQKIEELTLYAIGQQKELERLKTENDNYKSLAERLSAIEKELKK